jgi:hypothetical protein
MGNESKKVEDLIQESQDKITALLKEVADKKKFVNALYEGLGQPIPYEDVNVDAINSFTLRVKPNQFFERPLSVCVREILELKGHSLTEEEIFEWLIKGGYDGLSGRTEAIKHRNLRISLVKQPDLALLKTNNTFWFTDPKKKKKDKEREKQEEAKIVLSDSAVPKKRGRPKKEEGTNKESVSE